MDEKRPDIRTLRDALQGVIQGEVRFDEGSRALYSTDGSNYRQIPIGVVIPKSLEDVIRTVEACRKLGAPIVARGGGTSLTGSSCNIAVVIDFSKYLRKVLDLNPVEKYAWVEPGTICDTLRDAAEEHGLTFGPDPSTHNHCVIGGMIGNNSCGMHAQMAGRVSDNIHELDILTYDGLKLRVGETSAEELAQIIREGGRRGEIYSGLKKLSDRYGTLIRERYPKIPRRVSGYNLDDLLPENGFHVARSLVGTEGTCVLVLAAKARLIYSPPKRSMLVIGFDEIATAADHVPLTISFGPTAIEGLDDKLVQLVRAQGRSVGALHLLPEGRSFLMVEFGGETKEESDGKAHRLMEALAKTGVSKDRMNLADDAEKEKELWKVREAGLGTTAFTKGKPDTHEGWEDSAVPPEKLGDYLRDFRKLLDKFKYDTSLYGHFGQACVHCRIDFDLKSQDGILKYRRFIGEAADLVVSYGGSLSGEHGDGQSRAELLPKMFGPELVEAFGEFKRIWDPMGKMNPGKVVDAYRPTDNLRFGTDYDPKPGTTYFHYPEDNGSFAHATERCVGVGECRREQGGTMCPSFRVTREEMHSTRGRTHMLFETVRGGLKKGWHDEHVKEALGLCLSCKGCKGDCPVQVDVATLKAEFLSHYYKGRLRPRVAYSIGGIYWWARLASRIPRLVNAVTQSKLLGSLVKKMGGITTNRAMPTFALQTFKSWWRDRPKKNENGEPVILWADTFNNNFTPEIAIAAVEVLEDAGFRVIVPKASLCCGRPLYDYGFLAAAKKLLLQILQQLEEPIRNGVPIVGLEPSCMAVFRDELTNLLPTSEQAIRLKKQSFLLGEFMNQRAINYVFPKLPKKAVAQPHCHHKAIFGTSDEEEVLKKMGVDCEMLDSGCCGLAGSFGFEAEHFDISRQIGEYKMAPKIRRIQASDPDILILANGFSCQHQIRELCGKKPLHLAQVMQLALRQPQAFKAEVVRSNKEK